MSYFISGPVITVSLIEGSYIRQWCGFFMGDENLDSIGLSDFLLTQLSESVNTFGLICEPDVDTLKFLVDWMWSNEDDDNPEKVRVLESLQESLSLWDNHTRT